MRKFVAFTGCILVAIAGSVAANPTANEILTQSDTARGGGLPGIEWQLHILAEEGADSNERELIVKADSENSLASFTAPRNISDQKLLMVGRNMWFIREGLRRPVPLSPRQRLIGEASNGDVAATNYAAEYDAVLNGIEAVDGREAYKLRLTAKHKSATYSQIDYWVEKLTGLAIKAEFFTVSGRVFKVAQFEYENVIEHDGKNIPFLSKMIIEDTLKSDQVTTLTYSDVQVVKLPRRTFDLNFLTR